VLVLVAGVTAFLSPLSSSKDDASSGPGLVTTTLEPISSKSDTPVRSERKPPAVPAGSGKGRRVVFSQADQRVWLVEANGSVTRSYRVSGSRFDNLDAGSYRVQARYRNATSFDSSGTMEYFVEFTTGWSEPIGFHSIPVDGAGKLEQSTDQLGQPLSAGCVRQDAQDAAFLWDWAPIGTPVVVL